MLKLFNFLGSNISIFGFLYLEVTTTVVVLLEKFEYTEDIQMFWVYRQFILSSEGKNAYFMSGKATNKIYFFSLH